MSSSSQVQVIIDYKGTQGDYYNQDSNSMDDYFRNSILVNWQGKSTTIRDTSEDQVSVKNQSNGEFSGKFQDYPSKISAQHIDNCIKQAKQFKKQKKYTKAISILEELTKQQKDIQQKNLNEGLTLHSTLGSIYEEHGDYKLACDHFGKCLQAVSKWPEGHGEDVITYFNKMGSLYVLRKNDVALEFLEIGLNSCKILQKEGTSMHSAILNNIGNAYINKKQYSKALEAFEQSEKISQTNREYIKIARTIMNVGVVYIRQKKFQDAIKQFQRSKEILESQFLKNSTDYALTLQNLGNVYFQLKQYQTSEEYYRQCAKLWLQVQGQTINYAEALRSLAYSQKAQKEKQLKALKNFKTCLNIFERILGSKSPESKSILKNIDDLKDFLKVKQEFFQAKEDEMNTKLIQTKSEC